MANIAKHRRLLDETRAASAARQPVSIGAQVRLYRRGADGQAEPGDLLPQVHGGLYHPLLRCYVGPPASCAELTANEIHREVAAAKERTLLFLGAPGSGKSEEAVLMAILACLEYPARPGGFVAPTLSLTGIAMEKFLAFVEPRGWVKRKQTGGRGKIAEVQLINDAIAQFVGTTKSAAHAVSPVAGRGWFWAVRDEDQGISDADAAVVDARLRVNKRARVFAAATNEPYAPFQARVRKYNAIDTARVVRLSGYDNVWVHPEHWESLRLSGNLSPSDFDRLIRCMDIPLAGRVYPEFLYEHNVKTAPPPQMDITAHVTREVFGTPYDWIVGMDFGTQTTYSVVAKVFHGAGHGERQWVALHEFVTRGKTTDWHAHEMERWFLGLGVQHQDVIIVGDPHTNTAKEVVHTDYVVLRNRGWNAVRATAAAKIDIKHRYAMVNALLCDTVGRRRLFVAKTNAGTAACPDLVQSFDSLMFGHFGQAETFRKDPDRDLTHPTDALGYLLFPFERIRGTWSPPAPVALGGPRGFQPGPG